MNKIALTRKFIILLLAAIVIIGGIIYYFNNFSEGDYSISASSELAIFQEIIDEYSECHNKNDTICQCNYLTQMDCNNLMNGTSPKTELALNVSLIKPFQEIRELSSEEVAAAKLDPEIYTRLVSFSFLHGIQVADLTRPCFFVGFIEENGKWKIFEPYGPIDPSYCQQNSS